MTLCDRLIGGAVNLVAKGFDLAAPFWQTPREVEWAKAAADGLAEREAEEEVAEPLSHWKVGDSYCGLCGENITAVSFHACPMHPKTSAPTPGAVDGSAEGEPPEPSAGVGTVCIMCFRPSGNCDCVERLFGPFPARSAEVEPPASAPSVECGGQWRFTADEQDLLGLKPGDRLGTSIVGQPSPAPEFDWVTTAIPVIAGVLSEHVPSPQCNYILCLNRQLETCGEFANWADWRNHVAPHIAVDIQSDCLTTTYDFPSGDRPRPLADFPKHQ